MMAPGVRGLWHRSKESTGVAEKSPPGYPSILDTYVRVSPSPQNALDLFAGEWASRFPPPLAELKAGQIPLFEDDRVAWALEEIGDLAEKSVLELGPLEGGHTWQLTRAGARVTAIEANSRAYLKCLIAKELLSMTGARFLLGDFMEYLEGECPRFEVCFASGVLYHMREPVHTLELLAGVAHRLMLWTHVYDEALVIARPELSRRFTSHSRSAHDDFEYTLHRFEYAEALTSTGFCGGSAAHSNWLTRADLLGALEHFGWRVDSIAFDEPTHANGPALAIIATNQSESDPVSPRLGL